MISMGYIGNINPLAESVSMRTSINLILESRMGFLSGTTDFKPKLRMVLSVFICNIHGEQ